MGKTEYSSTAKNRTNSVSWVRKYKPSIPRDILSIRNPFLNVNFYWQSSGFIISKSVCIGYKVVHFENRKRKDVKLHWKGGNCIKMSFEEVSVFCWFHDLKLCLMLC